MVTIRIDESKYSLESRLINASPNVKKLLDAFNERIFEQLLSRDSNFFARTHLLGLTYFVTPRKAFIYLNIRQDYLSLKFFTSKSSIEGLQKGNWSQGNDRSGSEIFKIEDYKDLEKAIDLSTKSFEITLKNMGHKIRMCP